MQHDDFPDTPGHGDGSASAPAAPDTPAPDTAPDIVTSPRDAVDAQPGLAAPPSGSALSAEPFDPLIAPWLDDIEKMTKRLRHDGWTPQRKRRFLERLAECGVVSEACRAASMGATAAYNLRNRCDVFAAGWDAALALARRRLADELFERSMRGIVTQVVHKGAIIGERHSHDNRLAMAILARLDRRVDDAAPRPGQSAQPHHVVMKHWDGFLASLSGRDDGDPADTDPIGAPGAAGAQHSCEVDTPPPAPGDLSLHTLVRTLAACAQADAGAHEGTGGEHPDDAENNDDNDDGDDHDIWDDEDGMWWTDYPPPPGFDGIEHGRYGDFEYRRELDDEEQESVERDEASDAEEDAADRALAEVQRRAAFGLPDPDDPDEECDEEEDGEDEEDEEDEDDWGEDEREEGGESEDGGGAGRVA